MSGDEFSKCSIIDVNDVVARLLDDVGDTAWTRGKAHRIAEISEAVAERDATMKMALEIVKMSQSKKGWRINRPRKRIHHNPQPGAMRLMRP